MSAPDETGALLKFGGWVATGLIGAFSTLVTVLGKRIVDKHDEEIGAIKTGIKEVSEKLDSKADQAELSRQRDHIGQLFDRSREDKEEILGAIHSLSTTMLTEFGKRPTREELAKERRR